MEVTIKMDNAEMASIRELGKVAMKPKPRAFARGWYHSRESMPLWTLQDR